MKILFFGTPEYVVPILEALHKEYNRGRERQLIGVVTQPPQKVGREQTLTYSEVDHFAHKHKIPIFFEFEDLPDFDLAICAAYGRIIPEDIVSRPKYGILNIHPSLLPLWRGTAPTQAAIISGEPMTGVTVLKTDNLMDHGPIVSSFKSEIKPDDTNETLRVRLFEESIQFIIDLIPNYLNSKILPKPQEEDAATFTKMLKKEFGHIKGSYLEAALSGESLKEDWEIPFLKDFVVNPTPESVDRFIRAVSPWPGAYTSIKIDEDNRRLKILKAHIEENKLILHEVQLEGKNAVTWEQFKDGYPKFEWN